jgi:hypothetical protein
LHLLKTSIQFSGCGSIYKTSSGRKDMDEIIRTLPNYLTKETITVVGAIATAWIGWKVAAKSFGIISSFATKFSFFGITAAVMFICGLGATGFGIAESTLNKGELRTPNQNVILSDEFKELIAGEDPELVKAVLAFMNYRSGDAKRDIRVQSILRRVSNLKEDDKNELLKYLQNSDELSEYTPVDYNSIDELVADPLDQAAIEENKPSIGYSNSVTLIFIGVAVTITSIVTLILKPDAS